MRACCIKHTLRFKAPSGTSRGVLHDKDTWFLLLRAGDRLGVGEVNMFRGLSYDDRPDFEQRLHDVCEQISNGFIPDQEELRLWPSIRFGLEQALKTVESEQAFLFYPSPFTQGREAITINGLIWMGSAERMLAQARDKINQGFACIKMKIGAIDFEAELQVLQAIRAEAGPDRISLRVDANGAYDPEQARRIIDRLEPLGIHSIEQPIRTGTWDEMAALCQWSPVPIALDEELIGTVHPEEKRQLIDHIRPPYIIIKPSLLGGFSASEEWIGLATDFECGYWVTSALESNVGLNAIAQWTWGLQTEIPQGLGTGGLFTNNFTSPLEVEAGRLHYRVDKYFDLPYFSRLCT